MRFQQTSDMWNQFYFIDKELLIIKYIIEILTFPNTDVLGSSTL